MKILRIVGARPQFMQVPVLKEAFSKEGWQHILVHTGQHYDHKLSQGQFDDLGLGVPDYNLNTGSGSQGAVTGRMTEKIESVLLLEKPDLVVVDGDTNSTLATALAVIKLPMPLVHVEAGLRDHQRGRPEEINRILTDHASDLNCAPIQRALNNLITENLADRSVLVGDLLLDTYCHYLPRVRGDVLAEFGVEAGEYHVMTLHRPENTDLQNYDRFCDILGVLSQLDKPVLWPVHPRARIVIDKYVADGHALGAIRLIEAQTYLPMLTLVTNCDMVLSDSGGLPREAAWSGRRCVILTRDAIWHDLLDNNLAQLAAKDKMSIVRAIEYARPHSGQMARKLFGSGFAADRVVSEIKKRFLQNGQGSFASEKTRFMLAGRAV